MLRINENFTKLPGSYLFSEIARRVSQYKATHAQHSVISLGIGDVTQPLAPAVIAAMHKAVDEMAHAETLRGYAPEAGYQFLKEAIIKHDFNARGISLAPDEVFVSDGAKSDTGNIGDILDAQNTVAMTDPVYPVYLDTNIMAGRAGNFSSAGWSNVTYLPAVPENGFVPALPHTKVDMIYLCYPNNPTGTTLSKAQLKQYVDYARRHKSLILFDAAYEAFITEPGIPHSIYEIEGAREVAIEFRSFSKTAGFTGLRCGYTVVPKALKAFDSAGNTYSLNELWHRRQCTKFNGTAYIVQRAAEAVYSPQGQEQVRQTIDYYMQNAQIIKEGMQAAGHATHGGINAPYIWVQTPRGASSWQFFDELLNKYQLVCTPGVGFGTSGEGFVRMSALGTHRHTIEAMERLNHRNNLL